MKKIIKLTESDLARIINRVISESKNNTKRFQLTEQVYQFQKVVQGPQGDPYQYATNAGGEYFYARKGSNNWIKQTKEQGINAIKTKIYGEKAASDKSWYDAQIPSNQSQQSQFKDIRQGSQNDPYQYAKKDGKYFYAKKGTQNWIEQTKEQGINAIKTKIYGEKGVPSYVQWSSDQQYPTIKGQ
jgi:hypothetical protein